MVNCFDLNDPQVFLGFYPQYAGIKTVNMLFVAACIQQFHKDRCSPRGLRQSSGLSVLFVCIPCSLIHQISQGVTHSLHVVRNNAGALNIMSVIIYDIPGAGWSWNTDTT